MKNWISIRGGFSEAVTRSVYWKEYVDTRVKTGAPVFGYVGSSGRTEEIDRIVEGYFIMKELSPEATACWITSTTARHFADHLYSGIKRDEVLKLLDEYTKHVYLDLAIWNFPGYKGTMKDFDRIKEKIIEELRERSIR